MDTGFQEVEDLDALPSFGEFFPVEESNESMDELITMKETAAILNIFWQRVQQLVAEGKLGPVTAESGGRTRILFRRYDVERLRADGIGYHGRT